MTRYYVFYGQQLWGEYQSIKTLVTQSFPDGIYIYEPDDRDGDYWFLKDLTPVLDEDVPKVLKTLVLLMNI